MQRRILEPEINFADLFSIIFLRLFSCEPLAAAVDELRIDLRKDFGCRPAPLGRWRHSSRRSGVPHREFVSDLKVLTTLRALAGNGGDHWSSMLLALCCRSAKPKCRNARSAPCPAQPLSAVENLLCETLHFPWS